MPNQQETAIYVGANYNSIIDTMMEYGAEEINPISMDDQNFVTIGKTADDQEIVTIGKTADEQNIVIQGVENLVDQQNFVIFSAETLNDDQNIVTIGKTADDQNLVVLGKSVNQQNFIVFSEELFRPVYNFVENEIGSFKSYCKLPINEVTIRYAYDFVDSKFRASLTKHNPISKELYLDSPTTKRIFEMYDIQDQFTANKIADMILKGMSIPEVYAEFVHNLLSFYVEENDPVTITHLAGFGPEGFVNAPAFVVSRNRSDITINYKVVLKPLKPELYVSTLLRLTIAQGVGRSGGITLDYNAGVLTVTVYALVEGSPSLEGAKVIINGEVQFTNTNGQAYFNLSPGTYKAYLTKSGYVENSIVFTL